VNGISYNDIPPLPNTKILASAFPLTAPTRAVPNRADAFAVVDMFGMVSLTHNSTAAPNFTLLAWSDVCGFWIVPYAAQACAQYVQINWKVMANVPIYIYASTALTGTTPIVVLGGVTIQGNNPVITAGA
jgi:hypothetical protein